MYISGIIYLHKITDVRMTGAARRNLQMVQSICGDDFISRLTLVTTMWDSVRPSVGKEREKQLQQKYWSALLEKGATYARYDGTTMSANNVVDKYLQDDDEALEVKPSIEVDVVVEGLPLRSTAAGQMALESLRDKIRTTEKTVEEMKAAKEEMKSNGEPEADISQIRKETWKKEDELKRLRRVLASHEESTRKEKR